ncbi:hypothetical protein GF339_05515 [candidate division KSB3 bacterium]|uniref:Glycosyl transferase family 1 domain-containing protein n=1 Tax=candidate division KSB3 bacterium TaxID=2044937 RepID=A0A9D5JU35_9BACT|nr:hypothetical protein [candidate division KSB3 bacterium]MBD3324021.1 hypothetical protein [candidate division KSB3 bacterium]
MKISLGMTLQPGPWGGGNQFGHSLAAYLRSKGVDVYFDLSPPDLDLILLTEPRPHLQSSAFTDKEIRAYLARHTYPTLVMHRINECDERKGTHDVNQILINANSCADYTIFISRWLQDLFFRQGLKTPDSTVILNGANSTIFHRHDYRPWNKQEKLRLVTHHWGGLYLKGFDMYVRVDELVASPAWKERLDFTYIGNLPEGVHFANATYIPPHSGRALAKLLARHHVYLTASQYEPAGMHHIEGAMCGLPLLYRESGGIPEYCQGYGLSFTAANFEQQLQKMIATYDSWVDRMASYPHTAEKMCEQYYQVCLQLVDQRDAIIRRRKWRHRALWLMQQYRGKSEFFRHLLWRMISRSKA